LNENLYNDFALTQSSDPLVTNSTRRFFQITLNQDNCSWSIARSRAYWRQMFGTEEVGLSVSDALRKFFLGEMLGV